MIPADLIYYPDAHAGISRRRCGRGFRYIAPTEVGAEGKVATG